MIEVHLDLGGYPVTIADTAGLREAAGNVEAEGVKRALARAEAADLKLVVFDASEGPPRGPAAALVDGSAIAVFNKIDLAPAPGDFGISVKTCAGLETLIGELRLHVEKLASLAAAPGLTRERHREALAESAAALERAVVAASPELAAEDLRLAARSIGRITGRVGVEDMLDVIFRDFCIGK